MTRARTLIVVGMVLGLSVSLRAQAPEKDLANEVAELRARVERLEKENEKLMALVEASNKLTRSVLEMQHQATVLQGDLKFVPAAPAVVQPKEPGVRMPEGTQERSFNGVPVYVIPLETK